MNKNQCIEKKLNDRCNARIFPEYYTREKGARVLEAGDQ